MSATPSPNDEQNVSLARPGAGLPTVESWIFRHLGMPLISALMCRETALAKFDREGRRALELASEGCLGKIQAVDKRFSFPLRQRHAVDYVKPGLALVGDAAHTIHPLAGQGVNLGFQDIVALAEEIEQALEKGLSPGNELVLGRYQRRRKPDNLGMMVVMEGFKRLFEEDTLPVRLLRNVGMSQMNAVTPLKNRIIRQAMGL